MLIFVIELNDHMLQQRYTITAALPYTNGPIHIGHLAGVYVPADIYARYLRMKGEDVAMVLQNNPWFNEWYRRMILSDKPMEETYH